MTDQPTLDVDEQEMTTEIVEAEKTTSVPVQSTEATLLREIWLVADRVAGTEFVPTSMRGKPDRVFAAMLTGRELGIGPMSSLKHVAIIEGKPNLSAEATLALIRRAGHKVDGEATDQFAEVIGTRYDTQETITVTYTLDDALAGGLIDSIDESEGIRKAKRRSKAGHPLPWENYTEAMLWARAVTTLGRRLFPDTTLGWFTRLEEPAEEI